MVAKIEFGACVHVFVGAISLCANVADMPAFICLVFSFVCNQRLKPDECKVCVPGKRIFMFTDYIWSKGCPSKTVSTKLCKLITSIERDFRLLNGPLSFRNLFFWIQIQKLHLILPRKLKLYTKFMHPFRFKLVRTFRFYIWHSFRWWIFFRVSHLSKNNFYQLNLDSTSIWMQ